MWKIAPALVAILMAQPLSAQLTSAAPGEQVVDRVVSVVGDTVLLLSNVSEALFQAVAQGQAPADSANFQLLAQAVLQQQLNDLMVLVAAKQTGITVVDADLAARVDAQMAEARAQFPSEQAFRDALASEGETRETYRQKILIALRSTSLRQQYMQREMAKQAHPVINESDIVAYFNERISALPDSARLRPATVSFRQVVVAPTMSDSARVAAINRIVEVQRELGTGAEFDVLARRFSDDPGTKDRGGDLGWVRSRDLTPTFSQVAFALRSGDTSGVVETPFGFHIIRVERIRGPERQIRHILVAPTITQADIDKARVRADSVVTAVRDGASISTLSARYNGDEDLPTVTRHPIAQLPGEYAQVVGQSQSGAIVGPMPLEDRTGTKWAVIQVTERQEAGALTIDDVREEIRGQLEQALRIEGVVNDLRNRIYVSEPHLGPVRFSQYRAPTN